MPLTGSCWRTWLLRGFLLCLLAAALAIGAAGQGKAQTGFGFPGASDGADQPAAADTGQKNAPANPQAVDTQALAALILILENPTLRQQLLRFIKQQTPGPAAPEASGGTGAAGHAADRSPDGLEPSPPPEPSVVKMAMDLVQDAFAGLAQFLNDAADVDRLGKWLHVQASSEELSDFWLDYLSVVAIILASASVTYWLVAGWLRRRSFARPQDGARPAWFRGRFLAIHVAISAVAIGAFWAVAYLLFLVLQVPSRTEAVLLDLVASIGLALVLCSLVRFLLCPNIPSLRLFAMRDEVALDLFNWLRRLILWIVLGRAIFEGIGDLQVPFGVFDGLQRLWGLAAVVYTIILVLRYQEDITKSIVTEDGRFVLVRRFLSRIWLPAFFVYAIGSYVIWALDIKGASILIAKGTLLTLVILFLVQPVALGLERWLDRAESASFGIGSPVIRQRLHSYMRFAGRFAKLTVYIAAALAIAAGWEMEPFVLMGQYISGRLIDVAGELLLILVICLGLWEAADLVLATYMDATDEETGTRIQRSARARTLVPLLRTILIAFLGIVFIAAALNSLGLDIAPLLATAGIVGIAIGFGAQKLVQDVITGLFMLFQDTISVGDIVQLGGNSGVVQRITIRTIELRDLEGNLYTIPFSSVDTVKNMSREFAFAQVKIGIAYRENADHVMEVLKQLGSELERDPVQGPNIVQAIEILGVDELGDNGVTILCRFKVLPQTQFSVRRAFLALIKRRFDELGIEIPFPQRTLHFAGPFEQPAFNTETKASADPTTEKV